MKLMITLFLVLEIEKVIQILFLVNIVLVQNLLYQLALDIIGVQ